MSVNFKIMELKKKCLCCLTISMSIVRSLVAFELFFRIDCDVFLLSLCNKGYFSFSSGIVDVRSD